MIRSSTHSLKFINPGKRMIINTIIDEYRRLLQLIVDDFWENDSASECMKISYITQERLNSYESWFSARMKQACGKQALMMLKSVFSKREKQIYMLKKLQRVNENVNRLQSKIDRQPLTKPNCSCANIELDSRFIDFKDGKLFTFVRISSIGQKMQLKIPIKETNVSKKWRTAGAQKQCIRLSKDNIQLIFEIVNVPIDNDLDVIGADQGLVNVLSLSNGSSTGPDPHGHNLQTILKKLSRKKKGSKGFKATQAHRENYINWSLNQLNMKNVKEVRLEKLHQVGHKCKRSRYLSHWVYTLIKDKLIRLGETEGFCVTEVPNEFRSQRCSSCGWVRKVNRKGKTFKCTSCDFSYDADLNAASNLTLDLFEVPFWVRLKKLNREGFFWKPDGLFSSCQEPIVPDAQK